MYITLHISSLILILLLVAIVTFVGVGAILAPTKHDVELKGK